MNLTSKVSYLSKNFDKNLEKKGGKMKHEKLTPEQIHELIVKAQERKAKKCIHF